MIERSKRGGSRLVVFVRPRVSRQAYRTYWNKIKATAAPNGSDKPKIDPRYARFRMIVRPSRIHRWGVFAGQSFPARVHVIEYTGVVCVLSLFAL